MSHFVSDRSYLVVDLLSSALLRNNDLLKLNTIQSTMNYDSVLDTLHCAYDLN